MKLGALFNVKNTTSCNLGPIASSFISGVTALWMPRNI
jgi:hypothetical protein